MRPTLPRVSIHPHTPLSNPAAPSKSVTTFKFSSRASRRLLDRLNQHRFATTSTPSSPRPLDHPDQLLFSFPVHILLWLFFLLLCPVAWGQKKKKRDYNTQPVTTTPPHYDRPPNPAATWLNTEPYTGCRGALHIPRRAQAYSPVTDRGPPWIPTRAAPTTLLPQRSPRRGWRHLAGVQIEAFGSGLPL